MDLILCQVEGNVARIGVGSSPLPCFETKRVLMIILFLRIGTFNDQYHECAKLPVCSLQLDPIKVGVSTLYFADTPYLIKPVMLY